VSSDFHDCDWSHVDEIPHMVLSTVTFPRIESQDNSAIRELDFTGTYGRVPPHSLELSAEFEPEELFFNPRLEGIVINSVEHSKTFTSWSSGSPQILYTNVLVGWVLDKWACPRFECNMLEPALLIGTLDNSTLRFACRVSLLRRTSFPRDFLLK